MNKILGYDIALTKIYPDEKVAKGQINMFDTVVVVERVSVPNAKLKKQPIKPMTGKF
jgi:hypothetical protein